MDLCSLFDPSDSITQSKPHKLIKDPNLDNAKKKDAPKGRRRSRRANKSETLPEESSFLCDPHLTTELLIKGGSYIESFIEPENCNIKKRKFRRRKTHPNKDSPEELNNKISLITKLDDNLGKNVNDLSKGEINKKFGSRDWQWQKEVNNVIDKFEKVNLKDDVYMAGDFNAEDLDNDMFYSSDDLDESFDESISDIEDSAQEVTGRLPPEPRFGNVEYKLQLVNPSERRFQHLVTQLSWRLRSGGGSAVYVVGVRDCGALVGLRPRNLRASLHTVRRMAAALNASVSNVCARRVAEDRAVAELCIRKLADSQQSVELRVAVMGANEAGKSTLIGVLTQGELDNGRGSARLNMFRHLHEVRSGNTSSLSHEILGFDAQGNVVNYGCSELMTAERIGARSAKLVSFLDLAGHHKYQKTTVHGLTGYSPHYAMLVISATAGINRMTEEHIRLLLALDLPFFIVVTKLDLAPYNMESVLQSLRDILDKGAKKKCPLLITDEHLARTCVGPQSLILNTLDSNNKLTENHSDEGTESISVFPVSCVRGNGINALHAFLLALGPTTSHCLTTEEHEACEFQIDEIFHVGDITGPVVGGLLARGILREGDNLLIGPSETGDFEEITVKSIYRNRVPCAQVRAGQSASLGLSRHLPGVRQGTVLLAIPDEYKSKNYIKPTFGSCSGTCNTYIKKIVSTNQSPKKKNGKRKNVASNNNLEEFDKENIDKMLPDDEDISVLRTDDRSKSEKGICSCPDVILLEDPNDPRGCIYFQASVRVECLNSIAIYPGFQATVHVGNVRQTAVIEGIMSCNNLLRAGETASCVFRFVRLPEYLRSGRKLLFRDGLETHGVGTITQVFPYMRN